MATDDGLCVVILNTKQLAICRLAPYADWKDLQRTALENWEVLKGIVGVPKVEMISTRFINRIDIPIDEFKLNPRPREFLKIDVEMPSEEIGEVHSFALNVQFLTKDHRFRHIVNVRSMDQVLIDHVSFSLDIDTLTTELISARTEQQLEILDELHMRKNFCFEDCITDRARRLFRT